jgi:ABC-type lipoprotein export system ATPase subunit
MLVLEKVVKTYPKGSRRITALAPLDLTVGAGEFVAVAGPSGSGKTTCLLIAGGLLDPDSGRVRLDGHDLHAMTRNQLAAFRSQNIGFVFQQYHLIPYLSVLENILAPEAVRGRADGQARGRTNNQARGRTDGNARGQADGNARGRTDGNARGQADGNARGQADGNARGRADGNAWGRADGNARGRTDGQARGRALAEQFGLDHRLDHTPAELSSGEKQRTALARALLFRPRILLADEITGNLDRVNAQIVLGYLREYVKTGGTVLLVTHDREIAGQADRVEYLPNPRELEALR